MKSLFIYLIFLTNVFTSFHIYSQPYWSWQNPTPTGNSLFDFHFPDLNTGYVAIDNFSILKTTNSGENWNIKYIDYNTIPFGITGNLKAIYFTNSLTGYVGRNGIFKTTNGGESWTYHTTQTFINSIIFTNENTGYAACDSGKLIKTIDGGNSWFLQYFNGSTAINFNKINFLSQDTGFAVGDFQTILKTTNQGTTWIKKYDDTKFQFFDINFADNSTGFACGNYGLILKTTNNGENWIDFQFPDISDINSINFISPDTGYLVANNITKGKGFMTTDGGNHWFLIFDLGFRINKINFVNHNNGIIVCNGGNIYKTTDLGSSWASKIQNVTSSNLQSVCFVSSNTGFVAGSNNLALRTTNAGLVWQNISPNDAPENFRYIKFFDSNNGYLAGVKLYKTSNSGKTWIVKAVTNVIGDIKFYNNDTGYYLKQLNDTLFKTFDGGERWFKKEIGFAVKKIFFMNNNDTGYYISSYYSIYPTTDYNSLYKTTNNGLTWQLIREFEHGTNAGYFNSVNFINSQTGFLSGDVGISRTTNGGLSWISYPGLKKLSSDMYFYNGSIGFVSNNNKIYRTSNSGNNWLQVFATSNKLNSYFFRDLNTGYVVGDLGNILKTTNGGISVSIESENNNIPSSIYLYQNYPNPFNPSTKITFELPSNTHATLNVYNVLGRLIKTIVNSDLTIGAHEFEFNAGDLSSGIYFYKLETKTFSQTKKMLLLK